MRKIKLSKKVIQKHTTDASQIIIIHQIGL